MSVSSAASDEFRRVQLPGAAIFFVLALLLADSSGAHAQALSPPMRVAPGGAQGGQVLDTCTLLGCFSRAVIAVRLAHAGAPSFDVRVETGDAVYVCHAPEQTDAVLPGTYCGDVRVAIHEIEDCNSVNEGPGNIRVDCRKTGVVEQSIVVYGTPKRIKVSLTDASSAMLRTRTFMPRYEVSYPNGKRCAPRCEFWKSVWTVE